MNEIRLQATLLLRQLFQHKTVPKAATYHRHPIVIIPDPKSRVL